MEDYKKEFLDDFKRLARKRNSYEAWNDTMYIIAVGIANPVILPLKDLKPFKNVWESREKEYLRIINKYNKEEQKLFPKMFAALVNEMERKPEQDLLGEIYMLSEIHSKDKGQFFTPYSLCCLMAKTTLNRKELGKTVHKKGYASIYDPSCGAGATLLAALDICKNEMFKKYNWQDHICFIGQDIDQTVANMCYIQLSLQGAAGYVTVGDTIQEPVITDLKRIWFTPMWFSNVWSARRLFHGQDILGRRIEHGR